MRSCSGLGDCRSVLSLAKEKQTTAGRRWNFSSPGLDFEAFLVVWELDKSKDSPQTWCEVHQL